MKAFSNTRRTFQRLKKLLYVMASKHVQVLAEEYGWDITNARVLVLIPLLDGLTKGFNILMKLKILMLLLSSGHKSGCLH